MAKQLIYLPEPDEATRQRITEVKFYLFIESVLKAYPTQDLKYLQFLETLADMTGASRTIISAAAMAIQTPSTAPTKMESVVVLRYLDYPIRNVQTLIGISGMTYYKHLNNYVRYGTFLVPKLDQNQHKELEKFLTGVKELLGEAVGVLNYDAY